VFHDSSGCKATNSDVARFAGWSSVELYGLGAVAPRARVGRMGGALLTCAPRRRVVEVDTKRIAPITRTSARLRVYRPEAGGMPAWELCAESPPAARSSPPPRPP
jgi:hypothetical protein